MIYQENAKEFLRRGFHMREKIRHKSEMLEELRSMAERSTANIDGVPGGRYDPHHREKVIARMVDLQQDVAWDFDDLWKQQEEAKALIDQIVDPDMAAVLYYRYLCYKTWPEISELTGLCARQVFRLNQLGLDVLEGRIPNEARELHF